MQTPKFTGATDSFHAELKKRVNQYFYNTSRPVTGSVSLYTKAILLTVGLIFIYTILVFFTPPPAWALLGCVLLGALTAFIGFNVMHDGAHGSFSRRKGVNGLAAFSLNILGGSSFMWNIKHNIIHHAYTNIDGVDDDIDAEPWLRMCASQKRYKLHRFQYIYFVFLYGLMYLLWVFVLDYQKYFRGKIGDIPLKTMTLQDHIIFWGFKVLYVGIFIALPVYMVGLVPFLIGFGVFTFVAGFILSIVFQLAHTVEDTHFPVPNVDSGKIETEWAVHQIQTTANFATKNKIICWLLGGLNFQIEHHLFPRISHIHYPAISGIIKQACMEHNLQYVEYPRMTTAIRSHVAFLRRMGKA